MSMEVIIELATVTQAGLVHSSRSAVVEFSGKCSPSEIVSKIVNLCDYYAANNFRFIAYSLMFIGCIGFTQ